jgi:hypothetical protein
MTAEELLKMIVDDPNGTNTILELKKGRGTELPDIDKYKKDLDPGQHAVFDEIKRPKKKVKIDATDKPDENAINVTNAGERAGAGFRYEDVSRIGLDLQNLIVKRAVSFLFGNPVTIDAKIDEKNEQQKTVVQALKRILYDNKDRSFNRRVARTLFSCTDVAELWYPVASVNNQYGFESKYKLRCALFSPLNGDSLYPYFDESGDMIAFSREFSITDNTKKTTKYFETYTDKAHFMWVQTGDGMMIVEGYPRVIEIGKIPVIYGRQDAVEWATVQILIERLEKLLSNFADTNDYHASPKIVVKGELTGWAKKGEAGAILQLEGEDAKAEYLSWQNAPESVKLEIETLLKMIYTITQTPDISFDSVKGIGSISGVALKLLFMDAHLKVADHQEVFDEYLQRRMNIIKAFIGTFNKGLEAAANMVQVEPVITPYMIHDEAADMKIWIDANGGNPIMSQKASFRKAAMTSDADADFEQYQEEQTAKNSFSFNEPTNM